MISVTRAAPHHVGRHLAALAGLASPWCVAAPQGWGWSFVMLGVAMILLAGLMFGFLVVQPSDVGLTVPAEGGTPAAKEEEVRGRLRCSGPQRLVISALAS